MQVRTIAFYNRPFPCGGAETVTRNLAYFFHARGMRVLIYTSLLQEELLSKEDRLAFETRVLPDPLDEAREKNVEFLKRSLVEEQVDVLIVQCMQGFPFARLRETVRHTRFIFCLHSTPLWEINDWRQRKSYQITNPTFMRRLEFIFLRKPVYRFTDKLKRRYLRIYASLLSSVDRFVSLCPQYNEQIQGQLIDYARQTAKRSTRALFPENSQPLPILCCLPKNRQFVPKRRSYFSSADSHTATNGSTGCSESGNRSNRNGPTGV